MQRHRDIPILCRFFECCGYQKGLRKRWAGPLKNESARSVLAEAQWFGVKKVSPSHTMPVSTSNAQKIVLGCHCQCCPWHSPGGGIGKLMESAFALLLVVVPVCLGYLRLQVLLLPAASRELKPLCSGHKLSVEAKGKELRRFQTCRVPECQSAAFPRQILLLLFCRTSKW